MPDELLTTSAAAELIQVHPDTLVRWANEGKVAVIRLPSGHRRFRRDDVEALLRPAPAPAAEQGVVTRLRALAGWLPEAAVFAVWCAVWVVAR